MNARQAYPLDCDPARVSIEIARLNAERRARPKLPVTGGTDFHGEAEAARWTADWHERMLDQHRRLGEWARFTGQPFTVRQAISQAERIALQKSLGARARAAQWEIRAAASVMIDPVAGAVA